MDFPGACWCLALTLTCCYELSALTGTMGRRVSAQFTDSPLLCNTEGLFLLLHRQTDTSDGGEMGNFINFLSDSV